MKNIIFYFSGTGNSLSVALSIADKMPGTEIEPITKLNTVSQISTDYEHVGFVYPCYYGHPPKMVMDAVGKMSFNEQQKKYAVATYGANLGYSLIDMNELLKTHTKQDVQCFSVCLPGNHILGYPAWPQFIQKAFLNSEDKKVAEIVAQIKQGNHTKLKRPSFKEKAVRFISGENDTKLSQFNEKGTHFSATDKCTKCGKCLRLCPMNNIRFVNKELSWGNHCQQCMACIQWCPQEAVIYPNVPIDRKHYHHPAINIELALKYKES